MGGKSKIKMMRAKTQSKYWSGEVTEKSNALDKEELRKLFKKQKY